MANYLINSLERYLSPHSIPLYVEEIAAGRHPARQFHGHSFLEIVVILAGKGLHVVGDTISEISDGDVLLIYPGAVHAYNNTETLGLVNVVYDPATLALPMLDGGAMPLFQRFMTQHTGVPEEKIAAPLLCLTKPEKRKVVGLIHRLADELASKRAGHMFMSLTIFMELIATLCRCEKATASDNDVEYMVGDAINYMHTHLAEPFSLAKLMGKVNMTRRSFFRHFRKATGSTPAEYLKGLRFSCALNLLSHSDLSIEEIASRCGFCSGNYLCRLFRERSGMSPRQFRTAMKSKDINPDPKPATPPQHTPDAKSRLGD
ncbi:MAG: helix-turn-helix domain-containing protein [Victivallaceae bacterium]|nr:helix-turn-helix domain-containing protein [Victivallaceae bacterium]